ncbi:MAG: hypothetical protein R3B90_11745 [Planctomycetaceae bacterium]
MADAPPRPPRLRAPVHSGELLARPALDRLPKLLLANQLMVGGAATLNLQGRSLTQLREATRIAAGRLAAAYTLNATGVDLPALSGSETLLVTGHQPELFHPGVWAKNFAVAGMADAASGRGINLIIDNDLAKRPGFSVPVGPRDAPQLERVSLVDSPDARPWEELLLDNLRRFGQIGERVTRQIEHEWGFRPILGACWSDAVAAADSQPRLADILSTMRVRQEQRWGLRNLELPLSQLEETEPFRWFASHLFAHANDFAAVYNSSLEDFRREQRIRSRSHPVPALARRGEWVETPFWMWRAGSTQRGPLYCRPAGTRIELGTGSGRLASIRLQREADACCAVEDLARLSSEGWRIRSRALTTTMFLRLFLADLFVHGIGGAIYDQLGNRILERFFGCPAPTFLTLTATLQLPLHPFDATSAELRTAERRLRDMRFNPDRYTTGPEVRGLAVEKRDLAALQSSDADSTLPASQKRRVRRERHLRIRAINDAIAGHDSELRAATARHIETLRDQLAANQLLASREYAWCLFPEDELSGLVRRIGFECDRR